MRDVFHHDLDQLAGQLVEMTRLVGTAMANATKALLTADLQLAESVIASDARVDHLQEQLDEKAVLLLAQQQPVATDLRVVVSSLRMSMTLERMGDLAGHVAKVARLRFPHHAVPEQLEPVFREMGEVAERVALKAGRVIASRDLAVAAELARDDDELDDLHRKMFGRLVEIGDQIGVESTVDVTLLSRYYERFGDHAVSLANRVTFLVTGGAERPTAAV